MLEIFKIFPLSFHFISILYELSFHFPIDQNRYGIKMRNIYCLLSKSNIFGRSRKNLIPFRHQYEFFLYRLSKHTIGRLHRSFLA